MFKHGNVIKEVSLKVMNLERAIDYYNIILNILPEYGDGKALYSLAGCRFILIEKSNASQKPIGSPGLYHVAFTVDNIGGLKTVLKRILKQGYPLIGTADHGYTYAIYSQDPSGNGVEIYWDKPGYTGLMKTGPLPIESILSWTANEGYKVSIGHIHFKVDSLTYAERFFSNTLGMDVTFRNYPGALFFSYSGYHHHIGVNIWETYHLRAIKRDDKEYVGIDHVILKPPLEYKIPAGEYIDRYGNKFLVKY